MKPTKIKSTKDIKKELERKAARIKKIAANADAPAFRSLKAMNTLRKKAGLKNVTAHFAISAPRTISFVDSQAQQLEQQASDEDAIPTFDEVREQYCSYFENDCTWGETHGVAFEMNNNMNPPTFSTFVGILSGVFCTPDQDDTWEDIFDDPCPFSRPLNVRPDASQGMPEYLKLQTSQSLLNRRLLQPMGLSRNPHLERSPAYPRYDDYLEEKIVQTEHHYYPQDEPYDEETSADPSRIRAIAFIDTIVEEAARNLTLARDNNIDPEFYRRWNPSGGLCYDPKPTPKKLIQDLYQHGFLGLVAPQAFEEIERDLTALEDGENPLDQDDFFGYGSKKMRQLAGMSAKATQVGQDILDETLSESWEPKNQILESLPYKKWPFEAQQIAKKLAIETCAMSSDDEILHYLRLESTQELFNRFEELLKEQQLANNIYIDGMLTNTLLFSKPPLSSVEPLRDTDIVMDDPPPVYLSKSEIFLMRFK